MDKIEIEKDLLQTVPATPEQRSDLPDKKSPKKSTKKSPEKLSDEYILKNPGYSPSCWYDNGDIGWGY